MARAHQAALARLESHARIARESRARRYGQTQAGQRLRQPLPFLFATRRDGVSRTTGLPPLSCLPTTAAIAKILLSQNSMRCARSAADGGAGRRSGAETLGRHLASGAAGPRHSFSDPGAARRAAMPEIARPRRVVYITVQCPADTFRPTVLNPECHFVEQGFGGGVRGAGRIVVSA